jgi:hypothetical protein
MQCVPGSTLRKGWNTLPWRSRQNIHNYTLKSEKVYSSSYCEDRGRIFLILSWTEKQYVLECALKRWLCLLLYPGERQYFPYYTMKMGVADSTLKTEDECSWLYLEDKGSIFLILLWRQRICSFYSWREKQYIISFKTFAATWFNIVFSGAQPRQFVWIQRFGD